MSEQTTIYCGACGTSLPVTARFCRACGASQGDFAQPQAAPPQSHTAVPVPPQAPPPPPPAYQPQPPLPQPMPAAWAQGQARGDRRSAFLAIAGGAGMCLMVLYTIVYYPLHYDYPVNFGDSLQFGDLLALGSGALAVVLGVLALRQRPPNPARNGAVLMLAGAPTLVLLLLWAYPETFHLSFYPQPFYFGFVYYSDLGQAHIGNGLVQIPLLVCSAALILAGYLMGFAPGRRSGGPGWR